jgi:hypothetical protein
VRQQKQWKVVTKKPTLPYGMIFLSLTDENIFNVYLLKCSLVSSIMLIDRKTKNHFISSGQGEESKNVDQDIPQVTEK